MKNDEVVRDIPPHVRIYLNRVTYGDLKAMPFTEAVAKAGLPEQFYAQAQKQIYGDRAMTPGMLMRICKVIGDYTPLAMCADEIGVTVHIEQPRLHSDDEVRELLEANAAIGALNGELRSALADSGKLNRTQLISLLTKAATASSELDDVRTVLTRKAGGL